MQWWLLMGDFDGTLRYLHSYDEIMKGKGVCAVCCYPHALPLTSRLQCTPALCHPCTAAPRRIFKFNIELF